MGEWLWEIWGFGLAPHCLTSHPPGSVPPLASLLPTCSPPAFLQCRLASIKREEEVAKSEEERLNAEKQRHVRLLKRVRDEDCSRFSAAGQPR